MDEDTVLHPGTDHSLWIDAMNSLLWLSPELGDPI